MTRTASEKAGLRAVSAVRIRKRRSAGVRFYALDGTLCVLIEAGSEEDAHFLCRDVRLEFIALCEK
jgi:hypothetical protein